jgi:hypothetical protein
MLISGNVSVSFVVHDLHGDRARYLFKAQVMKIINSAKAKPNPTTIP